jgi:serine/threonine protein kinase
MASYHNNIGAPNTDDDDALYSTSDTRTVLPDNGHTSGLVLTKPPAAPVAAVVKREPALLKPSIKARSGSTESNKLNIIALLPNGPLKYDLEEIKVATSNFNRDYQIGVGACGPVFKCMLRVGEGKDAPIFPVAVKCLMSKDPFEGKQFDKEIEILSKYRHETLLPLIGDCEGPPRCIVTELMTNGSLYHRLQYTRVQGMEPMTWLQRINIAVDTATALDYLHNKASSPLIHRDVKSLNILLDEDYNGRLCDFGVVKDTPELGGSDPAHTHVNTVHVSGTMAYMPREYCMFGEITPKIDSFGFGVVLLELLTGRSPTDTQASDRPLYAALEDELDSLDDIGAVKELRNWLADGVDWPLEKALELALIARSLLVTKRRKRAALEDVLPRLQILAGRGTDGKQKVRSEMFREQSAKKRQSETSSSEALRLRSMTS